MFLSFPPLNFRCHLSFGVIRVKIDLRHCEQRKRCFVHAAELELGYAWFCKAQHNGGGLEFWCGYVLLRH